MDKQRERERRGKNERGKLALLVGLSAARAFTGSELGEILEDVQKKYRRGFEPNKVKTDILGCSLVLISPPPR